MTSDPIELLTDLVPELFNSAMAEVRSQADAGDAEAKQKTSELAQAAPLAVRVTLEGKTKKDLFVVFENGKLETVTSVPKVPVLFAFGVSHEAFELALEEMGDDLSRGLEKLKRRLPRLSPNRARSGIDRLAKENLKFHYVVKDTPDFEEVRVKIAIGDKEAPEKPGFTVTLDYEIIEQLRAKKLKPQGLLSKVQLSGDSSRAMQMVMEAIQRRGG